MTITAEPVATVRRRRKRRGVTVLVYVLFVLPVAAWAVVRFLGREDGPLVQLFAFTPYVAAWACLAALLTIIARRWLGAAVTVVAAAMLIVNVLPRMMADPDRGPATGVELHVMTANVLAGQADAATITGLVRDHDVAVLALQEFTPAIQERLKAAGLDQLLPYSSPAPEQGTSGSAIYSRFPITAAGSRRNGGGFLQAYGTVTPPGAAPLAVESVHPVAPYDLKILGRWRADLSNEPGAGSGGATHLLLGDFNATLDHQALRSLIATGYRDAADTDGQGLVATWGPYDGDDIPPVTIDHVLVDQRVGVRNVQIHPVPQSDHRSIVATLTVPAP